jgi:TPR repeat protein
MQPERLGKSPLVKMPVDPSDPNELWVAVGQGDTEAEVALARLYLTGRLVKKNCEQGRVLLTAASKKGNAEAISELRGLIRRGCR